jgi:hypothetical protein
MYLNCCLGPGLLRLLLLRRLLLRCLLLRCLLLRRVLLRCLLRRRLMLRGLPLLNAAKKNRRTKIFRCITTKTNNPLNCKENKQRSSYPSGGSSSEPSLASSSEVPVRTGFSTRRCSTLLKCEKRKRKNKIHIKNVLRIFYFLPAFWWHQPVLFFVILFLFVIFQSTAQIQELTGTRSENTQAREAEMEHAQHRKAETDIPRSVKILGIISAYHPISQAIN